MTGAQAGREEHLLHALRAGETTMTTQTLTPETAWTDGKRWLWLLSPGIPLLALLSLFLARETGTGWLYWGGPILLYGVIPLFDWLIGTDRTNPPESAVRQLEDDPYYRAIVFAYIPL